ncbi:MAG: DUF3267 domain-containing protein [Anaerolineaceae bacterium]
MKSQNQPTRTLPEGYRKVWELDMRQTGKLIIANVAGFPILILSGAATFAVASWLRPAMEIKIMGAFSAVWQLMVLIVSVVLMLVIHEGFHGLSFWIFTGSKPRFALKTFYAYAAAPEWYLPKWQYFITALAPFVMITLLGILCIAVGPQWSVLPLMAVIIFNATGAVGDLWVAGALLLRSSQVLAQDNGDAIAFFEPG